MFFKRALCLLLVITIVISQHLRHNHRHGHRGHHHHERHSQYQSPTLKLEEVDTRSTFYQAMPDCNDPNITSQFIYKQTSLRSIICPMIKDEIGFLSEYVAFYEMMGVDHIIFYDNNSTTSLSELQPWIDIGYVEVITNWIDRAAHPNLFRNPAKRFWDMMKVKFLAESDCKMRAIKNNFDIFISLDLDEYLFPRDDSSMTAVDALANWFNATTRGVLQIDKFNFNPSPHFLEPVNLLTIEAYLNRMKEPGKMNYYTSVGKYISSEHQNLIL